MFKSIKEWRKTLPLLILIIVFIYLTGKVVLEVKTEVLIMLFLLGAFFWFSLCTRTDNYGKSICIIDSVFFQIILGLEHKKPQHVAHHWVFIIGLFLESIILYYTFSESSLSHDNATDKLFSIIIVFIIPTLIFHQILIFRNFTVSDFNHNENISQWKKNTVWVITFLIFIGIGAVAGEFGYLFAVSKLSHIGMNGGFTGYFMDVIETSPQFLSNKEPYLSLGCNTDNIPLKKYIEKCDINSDSLKKSLKGIFVIGALVVCFLVIIWDFLAKFKFMTGKFDDMLWIFISMDISSLFIWSMIATFIIPIFSLPNDYAKLGIFISVLIHLILNSIRIFMMYKKLVGEKKYTPQLTL